MSKKKRHNRPKTKALIRGEIKIDDYFWELVNHKKERRLRNKKARHKSSKDNSWRLHVICQKYCEDEDAK